MVSDQTGRVLWDFTLPDQTCAGCGLEHPGEGCDLQDGLPLDTTEEE